jgi:antitoxin component of MazEF toxin-antitoxin module
MSAQGERTVFVRSIQEAGGSRQVILPSEVAFEWGVEQGDTVKIDKTDDGGVKIRPCEPV